MKLRHLIKNEKGIALVMVLVLSAISLAIMSVLIFMITSGTQISGMEKRYLNALEAAYGVNDILNKPVGVAGGNSGFVESQKNGTFNPGNYNTFVYASSQACLNEKLTKTADAANWPSCGTFTTTTSKVIDPTDPTTFDFSFNVPTNTPTHTAFVKIIDVAGGNTVVQILRSGSVVSPRGIAVPSAPFLYTWEVLSVNIANPSDRASLSILYGF